MIRLFLLVLTLALTACASSIDPEELQKLSTIDLCETYASAGPIPPYGFVDHEKQEAVKAELERRKAIKQSEWSLVEKHKARVGIGECALLASWGEPTKVDRTETALGDSAQYMFASCRRENCKYKQYAYVEQGRVIGLQY